MTIIILLCIAWIGIACATVPKDETPPIPERPLHHAGLMVTDKGASFTLKSWPIVISPSSEFALQRLDEVEIAVQLWNETLGFTLFVVGDGGVPVEWIDVMPPGCEGKDACTQNMVYQDTGVIDSSTVQIGRWLSTSPKRSFALMLMHEFGHAVGLDHDNDPTSIMHPVITNNAQTIAEEDLVILRLHYAPSGNL